VSYTYTVTEYFHLKLIFFCLRQTYYETYMNINDQTKPFKSHGHYEYSYMDTVL